MRRVIATVVGTVIALVLLLSFKTHSVTSSVAATRPVVTTPSTGAEGPAPSTGPLAVPTPAPTATGPGAQATTAAPATTPPTSRATTKPTTRAPATKATTRTVQGDSVDTRYGPVQVQVTLAGATITDVTILQVPDTERRDIEINNYAVPVLRSEVLQAQSAQVDMVSGATYTSEGYLQSLQSALDKAK